MNIEQYYTYKDKFGRDISIIETMRKIKFILSKYKKELILKFLNHLLKKFADGNTIENIDKIQIELINLSIDKYKIIHERAYFVLFQFFYEIENYNEEDSSIIINQIDVLNLFLLVNHLLDKNEYKSIELDNAEIPIELLMASFKMSTDFIDPKDIRIQNDLFIKFYEMIYTYNESKNYDKILIDKTGLSLKEFIEILHKFKNLEKQAFKNLFKKLEKSSALKYEKTHETWINRSPMLRIPFDYRFLEQYPLIKKEDDYYITSFSLLMRSIIMKPYHILSEETKNQRPSFRYFFTKNIAEPTIRKLILEIFQCPKIKEINVCSENNEYADFGILIEESIFLFEIKSVFMGLEIRYTDDKDKFKMEFEKRYILNDSGKHQQINQILKIENEFDKFIDLTGLDKNLKYKIFCIELVFDEVLKSIGFNPFNIYIRDKFNKEIKMDIDKFKNINPYHLNILITFNEMMFLNELLKDPYKKFLVLKNFFSYDETSLEGLVYDLRDGKVLIEGIDKDDFQS